MDCRRFSTLAVICVGLLSGVCKAGPKESSCQVSGCSGTMVFKGRTHAIGISAAHCAKEGKTVSFKTEDGRTGKATWVAVDVGMDLALFRIPSSLCQDVSKIGPPGDDCVSHGVNGHKTLKMTRRELIRDVRTKKKFVRQEYSVVKGKFDDGDSGGGVFHNGKLCGVISHGRDDDELFAATHGQVLGFLTNNNYMSLVVIAAPKGLNGWGDEDRTKEIIELKKRIADLEKRIDSLSAKPGPVGPAGPPGPAGSPGESPDLAAIQSRLLVVEKWIANFHAKIRVRILPRKDENDG